MLRRHLVEIAVVLQDVGVERGCRGVVHALYRARHAVVRGGGGRQIVVMEGFHLHVISAERGVDADARDVIRLICLERAGHFLEVEFVALAAREGVGPEPLHGQLVGQTYRATHASEAERALVYDGGGGEVEPDGQRLVVGEVEVAARPLVAVMIYVVHLALVGRIVEFGSLAQGLRPVALVGAVCLQLIRHIAALELLLGSLLALWLAAGVEVVAVREGGAGDRGRREGVATGGVVLTEVEAVNQGALAILIIYESAHISLAFLHRGVDLAPDETVGDGDIGIFSYTLYQACRVASATVIGARDVHIAVAVGDGCVAIGVADQSRQEVRARVDVACSAQVLDGGAFHGVEGGYPGF